MSFIREHRLVSIIVLTVATLFLLVTVFGKYIRNIINNYLLETKAFYFNSTVLSINGKNYSIVNWDGVNSYPLTIDLNNRKNDLRHTMVDITYDITYNCPNTVVCTLSKTNGVIHPNDETDNYILTITPVQNFHEGDTVVVSTYVESTSPYRKILFATYTIGVQSSDFSYSISDSVNAKFLTLNLVNAVPFYQASEDFGNYREGDHISLEEYSNLLTTDRNKCYSAIVTLQFNPNTLLLDMTNTLYLHRLSTNYQETTIGGYQYVSRFSFKVNASSSNEIIFYKTDLTQNYTYPIVNNSSIVTVSVVTAH